MILGIAAGAIIVGGAAHGAFDRNSPIFGRPITRVRTPDRAVALTFDDGPNPDATPAILDALTARGEGVEDGGGRVGIRPVVERQRDGAVRSADPRDWPAEDGTVSMKGAMRGAAHDD